MRYTSAFAALVAVTAAQGIEGLPACSRSCVATGISGAGCGANDISCVCGKAPEVIRATQPCVEAACNPAGQETVLQLFRSICGSLGRQIEVFQDPAPEEYTQYSATSYLPVILQPSMPSGYIPRPASSVEPSDAYPSGAYPISPIRTESCSTPCTTTITITVPIVSHIPSTLLSVPGSVVLSTIVTDVPTDINEPYEPYPTTSSPWEAPWWPTESVTGVMELSTWIAPQESNYSPTSGYGSEISSIGSEASSIASEVSSVTSEPSSVAAPAVPYPTETTSEPAPSSAAPATSSAAYGTGSYTSQLPEFTNAAKAVKVPAAIAGVVGIAACML